MSASLKLLTYNIHKGFSLNNRRFILHAIRDVLRQTGVDMAFLQEIHGEHRGHGGRIGDWPEVSQYEFLADEVWPHYAYGKNAIYSAGHHGNAILSKFPFREWENLNVSWLKRASRSLLHGVVQPPGSNREVHVICLHLDQLRLIRRGQLNRLVARVVETIPAGLPVIIAGDFNDWSRDTTAILEANGLREAHETLHGRHAGTYPSRWPVLALDRIYYRHLEPVHCETLNRAPWRELSDHNPLLAEFRLP